MAKLTLLKRVKNDDGVVVAEHYQDPQKTDFIKLMGVRLSYCFAGTPGEDESEDGTKSKSYRTICLLPKKSHEAALNLLKQINTKLMTANEQKIPADRTYIEDGDGEKFEDEKYKNNHGNWLVSCKDSKNRPYAYNQKGERIDDVSEIDAEFYSGAWANVMVRPWFFTGVVKGKSKPFPKRIPCGFQSLQKVKNDTPFGTGRIDDSDVYGAVEGSDGMDDDDDL